MDCKNCYTTLKETDDFCSNCGAKVIRNRLTVRKLFAHFSEHFLNYDNKFLQTLIHLFTKPELVIGSYINGTRKKYVNVVSYFAIALTIAGLQMFILNKFFPESLDLSIIATEETKDINDRNWQFIQEYQSILMMFYVPIYALLAKIVFLKNNKFNYTELLVVFMYILSQISIASAVIMVIAACFGGTIGSIGLLITLPLQIIYSAYCLKQLYELDLFQIIIKTLLFLGILVVLFILLSIGSAVVMYFNGDMEAIMEAKRAEKEALGN